MNTYRCLTKPSNSRQFSAKIGIEMKDETKSWVNQPFVRVVKSFSLIYVEASYSSKPLSNNNH